MWIAGILASGGQAWAAAGDKPPQHGGEHAAPQADPGDWPMVARDLQNRRFSPLASITAKNVGQLKVAWTFSTGIPRGHEGAPLVQGDTLYLVTPFPNNAYAFDLRQPGGPPKWSFRPQPTPSSQGVACCGVINRGPALWDGKLIYNTLDGQTLAVDARTGKQLWAARLADIEAVHAFQHGCFFVTAAIFWWALAAGRYGRAGYGAAVLFVFLTGMHSGILGALITFAGQLWYPLHAARTAAAGVDPLADQQVAGLIMWIPAGVVLMVLGRAFLAAWLGESERRARRAQQLDAGA